MTDERPVDEDRHRSAREGPDRADRGAFGQDVWQSMGPGHRTVETGPAPWWLMILCVLAVGVIAGLGAVVFRAMIGGFHNLLFVGRWSFAYDANVQTLASPWGAGIMLVIVLGAIGVAFLVKTFAPEAKGHGVPEVMEAIYYKDGRIRPVVALVKSVASALSIGSGGSVGREGPIIQIGAAFGSTLGQWSGFEFCLNGLGVC